MNRLMKCAYFALRNLLVVERLVSNFFDIWIIHTSSILAIPIIWYVHFDRPPWPSTFIVRFEPLMRFLGFCERIYWNFTIAVERSPVSELCKNIQRSQYAERSYEKEIASRTEQRRSIIWQILSYKLSWNGQEMDTGMFRNQIIPDSPDSGPTNVQTKRMANFQVNG